MEFNLENLKNCKAIEYCRKSTEQDDRQVASLDDQHNENQFPISRYGLIVPQNAIYKESKSAKKPGRLLFEQMISHIETGECKVIVTWQLNRLARNSRDAGELLYLLSEGKLQAIVTPNKVYTLNDKLIMYFEFGISDKYSDDLSQNVMRGMSSKVLRGWWPGQPKPGYLNMSDRGEVKQTADPDRFPLLRSAIEKYLTGNYSTPLILDYLNNDLGYRSRFTRNTGGNKLHLSKLYKLLRDPFYYGRIVWNNEEATLDSSVSRLMSEDEYWKIQELLGRKGVPKPKKYFDLPYRGLMLCPECGGCVIPYTKKKKLKSGFIQDYYFLRCTKNKVHVKCYQQQITFSNFETQVRNILDSIEISDQFYDWAIKWIKKTNEIEQCSQEALISKIEKNLHQTKEMSTNLLNMRVANEVTSEEFQCKKIEIGIKHSNLQKTLDEFRSKQNNWLEKAENVLNFAHNGVQRFETGTYEEKADIARGLGVNFILFNKKFDVTLKEPYFKFKENKAVIYQEPDELELANALVAKDKSEITDPVISTWWARRESNPHNRKVTAF